LAISRSGYFLARAPLRSRVLKPSLYHSLRYVDVAVLEDVLDEVLLGDLQVVLVVPVRLRRGELVVAEEAVDPALGVLLATLDPVLPARVPEMDVAVDNEVLLAILLVHE
jgi:hypothetical protein